MSLSMTADKAVPGNVVRSFAAWIHGTNGATYASSAALVRDTDGTLKRFNQVYSTAPNPIMGGAPGTDTDLTRILLGGSPLLVFVGAVASPLDTFYGTDSGVQQFRVQLTAHFAVYDDASTGSLSYDRTMRQFNNGTEKITRLLQYNEGNFPIYDYSVNPPQDNQLAVGIVTAAEPVDRGDRFRADWICYLRFLRTAT